jgi:GNAT superfamily N-acetyltransferase
MPENAYIVRELRVGNRKEAELLADMWNRSEEGWPGGWSGGVPITADRILHEDMTWDCYGRWVVECRGEIVGFISLLADPKHTEHAYIGLLNARFDHHGKGVGKRLVRTAVERAIEGGFETLEIHTWPGNLKAVPLYKKMGFFWIPESSVHMQNFIPTILRMPLLADFFREADWYQLQARDLGVCEDVDYWHGVRVFRYRFERDDRAVELIADRNARMITAVETDELHVAAWVDDEHLPALQEHSVHYEIRNKTERPMAVSLLAHGEPGVPVAAEETLELTGRARLDVPFRLPVDIEPKKPGEPPHRILTTVTVDGVPIKLGTAVQHRDPVEVSYDGWGFPAGKESEVRVRLRNRLPFPVTGRLWLSMPDDLQCENAATDFRVARGSWVELPIRVTARQSGAFALAARISLSEETAERLSAGETPPHAPRGREHTLWVRAFEPGAFVVSESRRERRIKVESDRLLLTQERVWGWLNAVEKPSGRFVLGMGMPEVGPPFGEFSASPPIYDVDVEQHGGAVHLTCRRGIDRRPGLAIERTLIITPGLAEVRHRLVNASASDYEVKVRFGAQGGIGRGKVTVPVGDGLIRHERRTWNNWPRWGEVSRASADFAETWFAAEEEGHVFGFVWSGDGMVDCGGGNGRITTEPLLVPAGGSVALEPLRIVFGAGDHKVVRGVWDTYVNRDGLPTQEERNPAIRDVRRAGLEQTPLLLTGARQRTAVVVTTEEKRELSGEATLKLPAAIALSNGKRTADFRVSPVTPDKPFRRAMTLVRKSDGPTAGVGELSVNTARTRLDFPVPIVVARGKGHRLSVGETGGAFEVDTGVMAFTVSAEHGGAVVSLRRDGTELLRSSYPEPHAFMWMNPWYGGVRSTAGNEWDRRYHAVHREAVPVTVEGASGLGWKGIEVRARFTHPDLRWLKSRVQYLTTAGSNLLAVVATVSNRTNAALGTHPGVELWPTGDGRPVCVDRNGALHAWSPEQHEYGMRAGTWIGVEVARRAVMAVAARRRDESWRLNANLHNKGSRQVSVGTYAHLQPRAKSWSELLWVVPARAMDEAHAYRFLADLDELP